MTNRGLASLGAAVIAMTGAWLSAADLAAQVAAGTAAPSAQATSNTWRPPRTPGGQPDLQGYWTSLSFTPLERPEKYGTREFLTDDELKEVFKAGVDHAEQAHHVDRGSVNCRLPPLTPQAMARPRGRQEPVFDSPEDLGVGVRCLTFGGPPIPTGSGYNRNVFIVQGRDHVVVEYEWGSATRVIPLDGRPHLSPNIRAWRGDSRGRWEGNTLVIETTNFRPGVTPANSNAATVRMTERFTRIDEKRIRSNTITQSTTRRPGQAMDCDHSVE